MSYLFTGEPGAGKTKMLGELVAEHGKAGYIVDFPKEKGLLTAKLMSIDCETIETFDDWKAFLTDLSTGKLKEKRVLGLDGLPRFYRDVIIPKLFPHKTPEASDYTAIHKLFEDELTLLKRHVPILAVTSTVDRSMDQVRQELYVTPDLPGRMAVGVAALFDFVFFLESEVVGTALYYRLYTAPKGRMVTKSRTPRPLIPVISLPIDKPAWPTVYAELKAAIDNQPSPLAAAAGGTKGVK